MVLKQMIIGFLFFFTIGNPTQIPEKYNKKINKLIERYTDSKNYQLSQDDKTLDALQNLQLKGEINAVMMSGTKVGYIYYNSIKTCKVGGCTSLSNISKKGQYEFFDLALVLSPEWEIQEIKILKYYSDYGYEITAKNYLKKYIGKSPCQFKQVEDVDGISGATISANALHDEIGQLCF